MSIRTDLAIEVNELHQEKKSGDMDGVNIKVTGDEDIKITKVKVINDNGAKEIGKPIGNYITIEIPRLMENDRDLYEDAARAVGKELSAIINLGKTSTILVVGLGNWRVTPDSLGPKVMGHLLVTRHIKEYVPNQIENEVNSVCGLTPGVLGVTGIETGEIIKGVVSRVHPDIVIAIDALAARKMYRVNRTIQITDTGIAPGAGVGNNRMELNEATLGVPVIGIGVPTVVEAATIASDAIDIALDMLIKAADKKQDDYKKIKDFSDEDKYILIKEVLNPYMNNLMVTPTAIDSLMENISKILANGINIALHPGISPSDIDRFIN